MSKQMPAEALQSPVPDSVQLPMFGEPAEPISPGRPRCGPSGEGKGAAASFDAFAVTMGNTTAPSAGESHTTPAAPVEVWDMAGWVGGGAGPVHDNGGPPSQFHRPPSASGEAQGPAEL